MQSTLTVVILIFASINFCGFSKITVLGYINLWPIIPSIKYFFRNISCQSFNEHLIFKLVDSTALSMNIVIQPILMKLNYYIFHNISNDRVMTSISTMWLLGEFFRQHKWQIAWSSYFHLTPTFYAISTPHYTLHPPPPQNTQLH